MGETSFGDGLSEGCARVGSLESCFYIVYIGNSMVLLDFVEMVNRSCHDRPPGDGALLSGMGYYCTRRWT